MAIKKDTLDGLLAGRDPQAVFAKDGLFDELKRALVERVLNAEIDDHLDGEAAAGKRNSSNGYSKKRVLTETSKLDRRIPRDREGTFDPKLIARYQRRFPGFDEKIVSMYARGMTVRELQGHLLELYGLEVSPDLISTVTEAVLETVPNGRTGLWNRRIRWLSSTRCGSKSATRGSFATRPSMSRLASRRKEPRTSWAFGIETSEGALVARHDRTQEPRRRGHSDRRRRWPQGISRGDRRRVSAHNRADPHRPSHPQFHGFRLMEIPQADRR
jgi:hypothetical protein